MDDLIGRKIGGYEIIELVGHGGMATVYRARQISMNRVVAVKVLPRQFLNDETYMQRFTREVKIVAELEHRNIVPVHDYGEDDGQPYIVMRYMSGGSVDDLLRVGALNLDQIVSIISQIAPALDYAHGKNVLHRDLKPSNILMDDNGGAYLTDFGIARLISDVDQPTLTTKGVVGTPSYMSPEQAQGQPLDGRSDIYSLGVMLFEMATGQRPFESETPYGIAVLQVTAQPPSPRSLNPSVLPQVEDVILTTMSKKREERYASAVRLSDALKSAAESSSSAIFDTQPGVPLTRSEPVTTPPPPQMNPVYTPPPPSSPYVISPVSGSVAPVSGMRRKLTPRPGRSIIVNAALGGAIGCGLLVLLGLIAAVVVSGILNSPTLTPEITPTTAVEQNACPPGIACETATLAADDATATGLVTNTPESTTVVPVGDRGTPEPLTDGSIVYFAERDNNFDIYRMSLDTRVEQRLTTAATSELYPAVSPDGSQIAFMSDQDGDYDIYVMGIDGRNTRKLTNNDVTDRVPSWSPDGEWIVFTSDVRGDGRHDLYRVRADGSDLEEVLSNGERISAPRYSPDGRYIAFTSGDASDAATWEIVLLDTQTGETTALTSNEIKDWSPIFAPDGGLVYLTEGDGHSAIARMSVSGEDSTVLYDGVGYEWGVAFSPSGELLTFTSDISGRDEIYLMPVAGGELQAVTELGGMSAEWIP